VSAVGPLPVVAQGPRARHWLLALLAALAAHAALLLLLYEPARPGAVASGMDGIKVALGPAGGAPGAASEATPEDAPGVEHPSPEASEIAPPETAGVPPAPIQEAAPVPVPEQDAVAEATPMAAPPLAEVPLYAPVETVAATPEVDDVQVEEVMLEAVAAEEAVVAAARPIPPKPLAKPPVPAARQVSRSREHPEEVVTEVTAAEAAEPAEPTPRDTQRAAVSAVDPTLGTPDAVAMSGDQGKAGIGNKNDRGTAAASGGGRPGASTDYKALLMAWLERHKEYPRRAKLRRQEGAALLVFAIDREGRLLDYRIVNGTGHELLDKEVAQMIERASPLPAVPPEIIEWEAAQKAARGAVPDDHFEYRVPVEFVLR
jgi:protein TonB